MLNKETRLKIAVAAGIVLLLGIAYAIQIKDTSNTLSATKDSAGASIKNGTPEPVGTPTDARGTGAAPVTAPRQASIALMDGPNRVGTATLIDIVGNNTRIIITMNKADRDTTLPANIHGGSCADTAKEVQYPLNPVVKGTSVTVLNVNIGALIDKAPQSIRIKSDAVDAKAPLAACGNLK